MEIPRRLRQMILAKIARENDVDESTLVIVYDDYTATFPMDQWGNTGTVHVIVNNGNVAHAVYGYDSMGHVSCYMS